MKITYKVNPKEVGNWIGVSIYADDVFIGALAFPKDRIDELKEALFKGDGTITEWKQEEG